MNEAPKKIWLLPGLAKKLAWAITKESEVLYIRADLVDELVAALEHTAGLLEALGGTALMARDTLRKLEES